MGLLGGEETHIMLQTDIEKDILQRRGETKKEKKKASSPGQGVSTPDKSLRVGQFEGS